MHICIYQHSSIFFSRFDLLWHSTNRKLPAVLKLQRVGDREVFESLENQMLLTIEIHSVILNISLSIFFLSPPPKVVLLLLT